MTRKSLAILILLVALTVTLSDPWATQAADQTYIVENTNDSGVGSLRWAIEQANMHSDPADVITINFNLDESDDYNPETGVWTITLNTRLPILWVNNITIDGYSQEGAEFGTVSSPPTLVVELHSNLDPIADPPTEADLLKNGLNIASANNIIRGLIINNFPVNGISIAGNNAVSNSISGNYIGTNFDGTVDMGNGYDGIFIGYGAKNNLIGGDSPADRNLISGNGWDGVSIFNGKLDPPTQTTGNIISGNYIGVEPDGTTLMGNGYHGVYIYGGSQRNTVGGTNPTKRNLISGNTKDGIRIQGGGTNENFIAGNYIGTTWDGAGELSNRDNGIQISEGAQENIIGGEVSDSMNLISFNDDYGIVITGTETMSNTIMGNFIGTDVSGGIACGNHQAGIAITGGASHNIIGGGSNQFAYNLISGNGWYGVMLADIGTSHNTIAGNYIGTDITGTSAVGNDGYGIQIQGGASENMIGGDLETAFNLISGNIGKGVFIYGPDAHENTVSGNYIGTDITGTGVISNTTGGVLINNGAYQNVIGGDIPSEMNLISGNGGVGVMIDSESHNNSIIGNYIGTDISGMEALGNKYNGVKVSSSSNTQVGGSSTGEGNLISGNGYSGIDISYEESMDNLIAGNQIGTDKTGTKALPNNYGVYIGDGATDTTIGGITPGAGNLISGNKLAGIFISGEGTSGNTVIGNLLGTDITGLSILENREGVYITSGAQNNTIGGLSEAERNVISGSFNSGVVISGDATTGNRVINNYIGVAADGLKPLGNTSSGLHIGGTDNVIGPANVIAFNWMNGIYVYDEAALNNVFTQNSIYRNGHGEYPGIELYPGAHGDIQPPEITSANASGDVSGTSCPDCTVELFWSETGEGQGQVYLGTTTASAAGAFSASVSYPGAYNLTATSTDERGTSEFSEVFNPLYELFLPLASRGD